MSRPENSKLKKSVLITGASRGIGRACTRLLSRKGWSTFATARSQPELDSLKAELEGCETCALDLLTQAGRLSLEQWINGGNISCIVHCLGGKPTPTPNGNEWLEYMELNFFAIVSINNLLLPGLLERKAGTIVHVSSSAASHGFSNTPYACSKSALNRYIINEGRKLLKHGVAMVGIMPAAVEGDNNQWEQAKVENTNRYQDLVQKQASGRLQTTDEIARAISWLCSSDAGVFGGCIVSTDPYL